MKAFLLAVLLGAMTGAGTTMAAPPLVVATLGIHADLTGQVAGDAAQVVSLVGPDADPHTVEPTPETVRRLKGAVLVVANGGGLEPWLPRLLQAAAYRGPVLRVLPEPAKASRREREREREHDHGALENDPHIWQSVAEMVAFAPRLSAALAEALPDAAGPVQQRGVALATRLHALDQDIKAAWATVPEAQRQIVTTHDAFGRYGQAYGVRFIAAAGISNEAEPGARTVAQLTRQLRETKARVVFLENIASPRLMESIARDAGARVGGALYSDALSGPHGPAPTYEALMRHNTRLMVTALGGRM